MPIRIIERIKEVQHGWADKAIAAMDAKETAGWAKLRAQVTEKKNGPEVEYLGSHEADYSDIPRR